MRMRMLVYFYFYCLVLCWYWCPTADALAGLSSRAFRPPPPPPPPTDSTTSSTPPTISSPPPKLILIGGCSGTGKSTFGMSVALDQGILKCISTDTLRSVMRSFVTAQVSPALHRSSYAPAMTTIKNTMDEQTDERIDDDPVETWKQTCTVLQHSVEELVEEMMHRRVSVVIEGVHLIPDNTLIERWEENGGVAVGVVLMVPDEEAHKSLLLRRGQQTGKTENKKLAHFSRIRAIHDELVRLAKVHNWQLIEQNLQPDPLEVVASRLWTSGTSKTTLATTDEGSSDEVSSDLRTAVNAYSTAEQLTSSQTQRRSRDDWNEGDLDTNNGSTLSADMNSDFE